jgi:hypothetical protein
MVGGRGGPPCAQATWADGSSAGGAGGDNISLHGSGLRAGTFRTKPAVCAPSTSQLHGPDADCCNKLRSIGSPEGPRHSELGSADAMWCPQHECPHSPMPARPAAPRRSTDAAIVMRLKLLNVSPFSDVYTSLFYILPHRMLNANYFGSPAPSFLQYLKLRAGAIQPSCRCFTRSSEAHGGGFRQTRPRLLAPDLRQNPPRAPRRNQVPPLVPCVNSGSSMQPCQNTAGRTSHPPGCRFSERSPCRGTPSRRH